MRILICFMLVLFSSMLLRAPTICAVELVRAGNIVEREWDGHSPASFGYLTLPPENNNNCNWEGQDGDLALNFDLSKLSRMAGSSFDVNKLYFDGVGFGEYALNNWFISWTSSSIPPLNGYNWTNRNVVSFCVGRLAQGITGGGNALQSIVLWYDGPISTDSDQGTNMTNTDEAITASGNGLTGTALGGPGTSTPSTGAGNSGKSDFVISSLKLRSSGGSEIYEFDPGQTISMEAIVKNNGDIDSSSDIDVRYYLSDGYKKDSSNDRIKVGTGNIRDYNLEKGELKTEVVTFSAPNNPGKVYNIIACADGGNVVVEKYETNNCSTEAVFRINGPFNFTIQSITLGAGKTSLGIGEPFSVDVVAKNLAADSPTDVKIGYYIAGGSIGTTPALIGIDNIKEINFKAGFTKSESFEQGVAPKIPGLYTFTACADFGNKVKESNENDNCRSINVQVNNPSPNPAHRKTSTSILHLLFAE